MKNEEICPALGSTDCHGNTFDNNPDLRGAWVGERKLHGNTDIDLSREIMIAGDSVRRTDAIIAPHGTRLTFDQDVCRVSFPFDEAAERVKFEIWAHHRAMKSGYAYMEYLLLRNDDGTYRTCWVDNAYDGWLACAKSRTEVK